MQKLTGLVPLALLGLSLAVSLDGCASGGSATPPVSSNATAADSARLAMLWQQRTRGGPASDFAIGPGDVLEISVSGLSELQNATARVSGDGTISLPLIGAVPAAGRTETELREDIRRRLEASVMYNPPVFLFVREYHGRRAGVIGAVEKPGFYAVASETETILDMIALAGGMTKDAAPRVHLIPESSGGAEPGRAGVAPPPVTAALDRRRGDVIAIDLTSLRNGNNGAYLNLPARPGDVIVVPERGHVLVEGYVEKPGSYEIYPDLDVLGAIAAAGGPGWVSDPGSVELIRAGEDGRKVVYVLDLEKIQNGQQDAVPVEPGDVIRVPANFPRLATARFVTFVERVLGVGSSL